MLQAMEIAAKENVTGTGAHQPIVDTDAAEGEAPSKKARIQFLAKKLNMQRETTAPVSVDSELNQYLNSLLNKIKLSPLEYWLARESIFPRPSQVFLDLLSAPC